ncbi:site-specific DNA-methyltransferase [bacterium]|nr:site-specific DNA-methyltransferase [bacterium]
MTQTSSFGTSKRESHDSSVFYQRSLYSELFQSELPSKEISQIEVPSPQDWDVNEIYQASSTHMHKVPNNSVALAFTSPPYNVGKEYDEDMGLEEYLNLIRDVGKEIYRTLVPGGRYVINIANLGRKPYIPLHSLFWELHMDIGFLPMGEIIWQKGKGASGSCAWGSWKSAKAPRLRDLHEYLLVFAKQSFSRPDKGESDIERDEFMSATLSIWEIAPESAKRVGHPAPFPIALAERVIRLYSYVGDVVLDPFSGSGTTCVAAKKTGRYYVGYDISQDYCTLSRERLLKTEPDSGMPEHGEALANLNHLTKSNHSSSRNGHG